MTEKQFNKDSVALVFMSALTAVALVYGFTNIPSPLAQQQFAADHKRVSDLGNIQSAIDYYYQMNNELPKSLNNLSNDTANNPLNKIDPQSKQPYGYIITGPDTYKLCATFTTDSSKESPNSYDTNNPDYITYKDQYKHPVGYYCFNKNEYQNNYNDVSPSPSSALGTSPSPVYYQTTPIPTVYQPVSTPTPNYNAPGAM